MNSVKKIFSNSLDYDPVFIVNDLVDEAIANINDTKELGPFYAENNPEFLAGFLLALTIDLNAKHVIDTLQIGFTSIVDELRKSREAE